MMKKTMRIFLSLALVAGLCLSTAHAVSDIAALFPASRAYPSFSDVAETDWYYENLKLCYETGLLNGKDHHLLDPAGSVTVAEAATIAARLHQILTGGSGALPKAPTDRGTVAFLTTDGLLYPGLSLTDSTGWTQGAGVLYMSFPAPAPDASPYPEKLILGLGNRQYSGTYKVITGGGLLDDDPWQGYVFDAPDGEEGSLYEELIFQVMKDNEFSAMKDKWYVDTYWYLWMHDDVFGGATPAAWPEETATRAQLFELLSAVLPESLLPGINAITALPDTDDPAVPRFYNAGILTGVDSFGTFSGGRALSRAELSAMVSRIIRPALRLPFVPDEQPSPAPSPEPSPSPSQPPAITHRGVAR